MHKLTSIATTTAAALVFSVAASAQTAELDYDFNWAPLSNLGNVGISGGALFGTNIFDQPHAPGIGDAIRRCYSVDVTQGGKNQSGNYESTWFSLTQGWGSANTIPGSDVGLVSIQSATDSDLGGDACLSPWASSAGNTGGHNVSVAVIPGLQAATTGSPWPEVWQSVFRWTPGTVAGFTGIQGPNTIGVDSNGLPLLANVIFEVQGPINSGMDNMQYYMGTTDEVTGMGAATATPGRGTGGVTNGNSNWGTSVYGGLTADLSGAVSHTRILAFDETFVGLPAYWGNTIGSAEISNFLAFSTPFLWAENNGSIGAGGPDWVVSSLPTSNVQLWLKDIKSGAQGTSDLAWKAGGGGPSGAIYDPTLVFNVGFFLWSATAATSMQQRPMSWDDALGGLTPLAGSYFLNANTLREGNQRLPIQADSLTDLMLSTSEFSMGTPFTSADSILHDTLAPSSGSVSATYEGSYDPVQSGISKLSMAGGGAFPVLPNADPSLAGLNLGVGAISIQVRTNPQAGLLVEVAEAASALTLTLQ